MKAVIINQYGSSDVIHFIADAPKPLAQANQLLVAVHSASLNPIDSLLRAGYLHQIVPLTFPAVLAGDFAGVVIETADNVTSLKVGDEVYGQAGTLMGGSGSLAEFVAVASNKVALKPTSLTMEEAASLPLTGASAVQAIEEHIHLQPGQKILIHGGLGGIGSLAIQLAKYHGAFVATTVDSGSLEAARHLGADQVIDYRTQDFTALLQEYDAVLVNAADALAGSYQILRKGGMLVTLVGQIDQDLAQKRGITAIRQMSQVNAEQLTRLATLVDTGAIKPLLAKHFDVEEARAAFTYFEQASPQGKVTISIR
ncbi:NADP-dependent oxidoreductase [Spirosoma jeollabukense]